MMKKYSFAISYFDQATKFAGLLFVDVIGESLERASREINESKHDRGWLVATFGPDFEPEDFVPSRDGIIVGEHALIATATAEVTVPHCHAAGQEAPTP